MSVRLAISLGDPLGIGPEVVAKACQQLPDDAVELRIFGEQKLLAAPYVAQCSEAEAARAAAEAFVRASDAVFSGQADALVTAPLHKAALANIPGGPYSGHTSYLAKRCGLQPTMTFVGQNLRVGLLSIHLPIAELQQHFEALGVDGIAARIAFFAKGLEQSFGIAQPRIAVFGLNPHASEGGLIGDADLRLIGPAIAQARRQGLRIEGPLPADGFFAAQSLGRSHYDGVLACYHDQGLGGFKALEPHGAQLSLGLPIIRCSVEHGTARDIAGQDRADPGSMRKALNLARELAVQKQKVGL